MSTNESRRERRREPRISPKGTVLVRVDTYLIRGRVANLSRTGLLAITRITAPERLLGARVELSLRLDGCVASWLELRGRVMRIGASSLAVASTSCRWRSAASWITPSRARRATIERLRAARRRDAARRAKIAEQFRAAGCEVLDVSTPLEAIVRLGESEFEHDLIAIADSLPARISDELRRFVDVEHPHVMLLTIGDAVSAPDGLAEWLSAANPRGDLANRVRDVLNRFVRH